MLAISKDDSEDLAVNIYNNIVLISLIILSIRMTWKLQWTLALSLYMALTLILVKELLLLPPLPNARNPDQNPQQIK